jgi:hypothetical protein
MVCITANVLVSNGIWPLIDQVMNPHNAEEGYYGYELADDNQEGVPSFEGAAPATISSLTQGIATAAVGTYPSTATVSVVSGTSDLKGLNMGVVSCFCGLAASVFSFFLD